MAESFEDYRSYLLAIAYRMLGSAMDAEDMVQETYLRFQATPPDTQASIVSLKAYLATIISRLCVNQLHSAHRKREPARRCAHSGKGRAVVLALA